ncbi:MAG: TPM domain-containing protein [Bacteroidales bacterium]|nr:TPM domain-containing protein [Bacteroidales bacterium]
MQKTKNLVIMSLLCLCFINASAIPEKPVPARLVNDFAGILSQTESQQLEKALSDFARSTSTQIAVVTVVSLDGYDVNMYANELATAWGIGQKGKDNGLVMLIKPKTQEEGGKISIQTGYGLEDIIPDAVAKRIIENEIIPYFKQQQYFNGIASGVNVLMELSAKKFTPAQYLESSGKKGESPVGLLVIFVLFFVVAMLMSKRRRSYYNASNRGGSSLPLWLMLGMLGGSSGRSHSGMFGNFSSGGGSFGGFGGGGFGGGGASGSW